MVLNFKKQQGAVLLAALILLPILSTLGIFLLSSASSDLRMTGARHDHNDSRIILNSVAKEFMTDITHLNKFKGATDSTRFNSTLFVDSDGNANVSANTTLFANVDCKRRRPANTNDLKCKYMELNLSHQFGRAKNSTEKWGRNNLGLGVEQPLLSQNR